MSNFPSELDDDLTLPRVDDDITEIGAEAINAVRSAMFAVEAEIGIGASGTSGSIADRFDVSINPDGTIKPSSLVGIGLIALPIVDAYISSTANIQETKLSLNYSTTSLYNLYTALKASVDVVNGFLSLTGIKVEPHIDGTDYNHLLSHIHINPAPLYLNKNSVSRDTTNANTLLQDINDDFVSHQKSDGTSSGTVPPTNFAHNGTGIHIDAANFSTIPTTVDNLQDFAEFADSSGLLLLGSRTQNLFSNGISRAARSTVFVNDGYFAGEFGEELVPPTLATAYLMQGDTKPVDSTSIGDDIVLFTPSNSVLTSNVFDSQFSKVKPGDILTITYGSATTSFVITSFKASFTGPSKVYSVRINGKNLLATTTAVAKITRPLFNENKYGVLATAAANNSISNVYGSLIVSNPRSASALGLGFNPSKLDATHYNLYLEFYPTGSPTDKLVQLPAIDITGNQGATPGAYTLESVIQATNNAFRQNGFNFRFIAYSYRGEFGIMLADHFNNASFSIISGTVDSSGNYTATSNSSFPNNIVDIYNDLDAAGFGSSSANVASPPFAISFANAYVAQVPTKIFYPLKRNFFYVNGLEKDVLKQEQDVLLDTYGDGYWPATSGTKTSLVDRVEISYHINLDLRASGLKIGKTIVIQPEFSITGNSYSAVDYGRFIISNISFNNCDTNAPETVITVYDAIHGIGTSPYVSSEGIVVRVYSSNDAVGFNAGQVNDDVSATPYKRYFEVFVDGTKDQNGHTFTSERARFLFSGLDITNINFNRISPKLAGYPSGTSASFPRIIRLTISSYDATTGLYSGFLSKSDGTHPGKVVSGKHGEKVRFYDETNIDFIEFVFDKTVSISSFANKTLDIDLYPSLSLDQENFLISSCQVNDIDKSVDRVNDEREFGNTSEKQFTNSAINFINAGNKHLHQNGVVRGFELVGSPSSNAFSITGGVALTNGTFVELNDGYIVVPKIREIYSSTEYSKINWILCANSSQEFELIPLLDYDASSPATPSTVSRDFVALNPVNASTYTVVARKFSDIVKLRKDLTILYKITSITTGTGVSTATTLTVKDAKKFAFESDAVSDPVFTAEASQGNFYSSDALFNWISLNPKYLSNVKIKGDISLSSALAISYSNKVSFTGSGSETITISAAITASNIVFNDINFVIASGGSLTVSSNVSFNNCTITVNSGGSFVLSTNEVFTNCTLTFNSGSTITLGDSISFIKSTITVNQNISLNNNILFDGCTISCSTAKGFSLVGNNIKFTNTNFTYTFDPTSPVDAGYDTANLINTTSALIYCSVSTHKNIYIEKCEFNAALADRYPFISFEYASATASAQTIYILDNKFIDTHSGDNVRAVISFVNNLVSGTTTLQGPRLIGSKISGNICNKNQMISISSKADTDTDIKNAIATDGCEISSNVCGTISALTRFETVRNFANTTIIGDKLSSLVISKNNCKVIMTGKSTGQLAGGVLANTGDMFITENKLSFLSAKITGSSSAEDKRSSIVIHNNIFNAYTQAFATLFGLGYYAIIVDKTDSNNCNAVITNNVIDYGSSVASDGTTETVHTYYGTILSGLTSTISNNTIKGIASSATDSVMIYTDSSSVITNNTLIRGTSSLRAYIEIGGGTNSLVVDNSFDLPTRDGSSEDVVLITSGNAVVERNKNQTAFAYIPLYTTSDSVRQTNVFGSDLAYFIEKNSLGNPTSRIYADTTSETDKDLRFSLAFNISDILPAYVNILSARIGANLDSSVAVFTAPYLAGNSLTLSYNYNTGSSFMDVQATKANAATGTGTPSAYTILNNTARDNLINTTQYLQVVPSAGIAYTEKDKQISVGLVGVIRFAADLGSVYFSPLEIKYRW